MKQPRAFKKVESHNRNLPVLWRFFAGLALGLSVWRSAFGQARPLKSLSLEQLGNIEVTTQSKEPEELWRSPAAISVLTQGDIRRLGATNVPDLLRMIPGVFVGTVNSSNWAVGIRGFTGNFSKSLLVLIDGRSVYTPLFGGVYWAVQDLVLEDIDRIEIIRGPGGTVWGENAVNGVINIITKNSSETTGLLTTNVTGNLERYNGEFQIGGRSRTASYRIFGKGFVRSPEIHPNNMDSDEWHMERGGFRTDSNLGPRDQLTVQGDFYKGVNPRESIGVNTQDPVSGGDILARWSRDLSHAQDKSTNLFVQAYVDRTIREGVIFGERQNTFDIDGVYRFKPGRRHDLILGAGYRDNPTNFSQHNPLVNFLPNRQNYRLYSAFGQDEIAIVPERLLLTLGVKAEHNPYSHWELQPTVRFNWRPDDHTSYWLAVTRAVRTPSQIEESFRLAFPIRSQPPLEVLIAGNPRFKSETLLAYEAGYRSAIKGNLFVDVAAFFNHYGRLQGFLPTTLETDTVPNPPILALTTLYGNTVEGTTRGMELTPDWRVSRSWRLKGSYSLLRYDLRSPKGYNDPSTIAGYVGSTPLNQFALQSQVDLPCHFEFDQWLRHAGSLPAQQVAAYTTGGLRLGWRYKGWELSAVGRDLLDDGHEEFAAGDATVATLGVRRSVFAKFVWTSQK